MAGLSNTLFETNCQNFDSGAGPNEVSFSGNNLKFLIVAKKPFSMIYNMSMFYVVCSKLYFSRKTVEMPV